MYGVSVVTLAYNEEGNLEGFVRDTLRTLGTVASEYEVIVVDDGSTDGTPEIADQLAAENGHVRVVHHDRNRGIGEGIRTGLQHAQYELVSNAAGDGQIPPSSFVAFLEVIDNTDVVLGMYTKRSGHRVRRFISFVWRDVLARLMFGSVPLQDGNYMVRRRVLEGVDLTSTTGVVSIELLYKLKRKGCRFTKVTVECLPRASGRSKVANWRYIGKTAWEMTRLRVALTKENLFSQ